MSISRSKAKDHKPLTNTGGKASNDLPPLRNFTRNGDTLVQNQGCLGLNAPTASNQPEVLKAVSPEEPAIADTSVRIPLKAAKKAKKMARDRAVLKNERWLSRNGHGATYFVLFLFSIMVLFRPYEIVPGMTFLSGTAFYFAIATLAIFIPSQLTTEGNLTTFSTEVKAILAMTLLALATIPIAKDPDLAWSKFNDPYIKAVVIFVVLVNVVRTRKRLMQMMWLSLGIGVYLSYSALDLYLQGKFTVEQYRVAVDVGGMFGNPNEMAMHFVMMTPLVITLGIAAKSKLMRVIYFGTAVMFVGANMVTYSRGGFLGLLACSAVLAWKLGRKYRLNVTIASIVIGGIAILAAPGNYGLRMLSIFVPGLDAVGSSDQRQELLIRSLWVTARNPWGIGIGNFPIVGVRNLQSHNAFTQVSAELGILGLIAYLVFMISPFRKLSAIERSLFDSDDHDWFYYLAIGLQASIIGYMVSSFFASVAYNWFIYYLIAYAVAFRRIYRLENDAKDEVKARPPWNRQPVPAT
jgi:putative inorganic carbon (HCO3(-)) transporter